MKNVTGVCPLPVEDLKKRTGTHTVNLQGTYYIHLHITYVYIHLHTIKAGTGTAFEGKVALPKPKGLKHGWVKYYAYLTGNKLLLHAVSTKDDDLKACFASYRNTPL